MTQEKITTFKGFKSDLTCRGFQFEIGQTYQHKGEVKACGSGFHACENPMDVFGYYPPGESRYALTESAGPISREEGGDTKIASATITIKAELSMPEFVQRAVDWVGSKVDKSIDQQIVKGTASNTGNYSAASNTGNRSAASNTGDQSAASNTGYRSAAEVSGSHSVAAAFGIESKARASSGGAIVLCHRDDDGTLIHIRASKIGENGVKADTWYTLNESNEFEEVA